MRWSFQNYNSSVILSRIKI